MNKAYLLIGGNMGDRLANLEDAKNAISKLCGNILSQSAIYETEAWGFKEQPAFYNQALCLATTQKAVELLNNLLAIELNLGRTRTIYLGPRTIDIDIIYFNDEIIDLENLTIPHASMSERNFVLTPLTEIAPGFIHPVFKKSNSDLLSECKDMATVYKKIDI
jgi:2-amino-4-hydroxy-6-hydroxymethyldihydropteridine diphosphokinase